MTLSNLATNPIDALGNYIFNAYTIFKGQRPIQDAEVAERYYEGNNDINNVRIMYQNDKGDLVEDTGATNTKISHGFFPELVDQKVQYILGDEGVEVCPADADDQQLAEYLDEYFNDDWQLTIQELIEGASIKGFEGLFARTDNQDRLVFQIADSLNILPIIDDFGRLVRVLRFYSEQRYSEGRNGTVLVQHCDVWSEDQVCYYVQEEEGTGANFKLDSSRDINPAPHVMALFENPDYIEGETDESDRWLPMGRKYDNFPFYILNNNRRGTSDLAPIKEIIDDYDVMNCFLSNNLQDMTEAFYVVKGFQGEGVDRLRKNIKARKVVNLEASAEAGVDIKTYNIPTEGRKVKMELDEVNIYRSGMGFNSQQLGDGNITNIVIKSRYALLAMKAAKMIIRFKACLKWQAELVAADINRKYGGQYTAGDIEFKIEPQALVNETDVLTNKKTEEETIQIKLQNIMQAAPRLSEESVLRQICEVLDLDYDDVSKQIEEDTADGGGEFVDPTQFLPQNNPAAAQAAAQSAVGQAVPGADNPPADEEDPAAQA